MLYDIFPDNTSGCMTDDEWIDYCIGVWCCNSLNAREGWFRHNGDVFTADLFARAQAVIHYLQDKTKT